ncbi:hypothetical protein KUDE01_003915 [Dissostichus eleginoides]|uniref:Uncharacterized protein n=1 Tax=Dissostichus eleginoides TaxID=100907 RepID=A0AAD9CFT1_DISEL|nr:hypothetical protein KUDE01_003915 [Dissostichus eleginoides]
MPVDEVVHICQKKQCGKSWIHSATFNVVPLCSQERGEVVDGSLRRTLSRGLRHPSSWLAPFLTPASPA